MRDPVGLAQEVGAGIDALGPIGIIVANAGIFAACSVLDSTDDVWHEVIDVNLTGVWNTIRAGAPSMVKAGVGGAIVITSSTAGLKGAANLSHYVASKHGVVGLMRSLAQELGPFGIRVNTVHPTSTDTHTIRHQAMYDLFRPDLDQPSRGTVSLLSKGTTC